LKDQDLKDEQEPTSTASIVDKDDPLFQRLTPQQLEHIGICESYDWDQIYDLKRHMEVTAKRVEDRKRRFKLDTPGATEFFGTDAPEPTPAPPPPSTLLGKFLASTGFANRVTNMKNVFTVIIGLASGLIGIIIGYLAVNVFQSIKLGLVESLIRQGDLFWAFIFYAAISSVLSVGAAALIILKAPAANGSGLVETRAYLNGAMLTSQLEAPAFLAFKGLAIALVVASGLPLGRETPIMHICAGFACCACQWWAQHEKKIGVPPADRLFKSDRERIEFTTIASAAGLAAAFRAPFAGVAFVFEVVATHWSLETCNRCMIAAAVAALVVCYVAGTSSPDARFDTIRLDSMGHASGMQYSTLFRIWEMFLIVAVGAVSGLVGSVYVLAASFLDKQRKLVRQGKHGYIWVLGEVLVLTILSAVLHVLVPAAWSCRRLSDSEAANVMSQHVHWHQFTCPEGQINELASLTLVYQEPALNNLFAGSNVMQLQATTYSTYCVILFIQLVFLSGTVLPNGLVLPTILIGASFGAALGVAVQTWIHAGVSVRFYALMGAAGALSAVIRATISMTIVLMELVASSIMAAPIMLCTVTAKIVGNALTPSIYDTNSVLKGLPTLLMEVPRSFYDRTVSEVAREIYPDDDEQPPPVVVGATDTLDWIEKILAVSRHNGFPVVADRTSSPPDMTLRGLARRAELEELVRKVKLSGMCTNEVEVSTVMEMSPWFVEVTAPAHRIWTWFIRMGMRHLVMVKEGSQEVAGMVTRHDLFEAFQKWEDDEEEEEEESKSGGTPQSPAGSQHSKMAHMY